MHQFEFEMQEQELKVSLLVAEGKMAVQTGNPAANNILDFMWNKMTDTAGVF